jgi:hypothetical protein
VKYTLAEIGSQNQLRVTSPFKREYFTKSLEIMARLVQENVLNSMPFLTIRKYIIKEERY